MTYLLPIIIMAMVAQGVFTSMQEGMILEPLKNLLASFIKEPLAHSFYSCPRCMVSTWGSLALLACWHFGMPVVWWLWPVYALSAVGLQELIDR